MTKARQDFRPVASRNNPAPRIRSSNIDPARGETPIASPTIRAVTTGRRNTTSNAAPNEDRTVTPTSRPRASTATSRANSRRAPNAASAIAPSKTGTGSAANAACCNRPTGADHTGNPGSPVPPLPRHKTAAASTESAENRAPPPAATSRTAASNAGVPSSAGNPTDNSGDQVRKLRSRCVTTAWRSAAVTSRSSTPPPSRTAVAGKIEGNRTPNRPASTDPVIPAARNARSTGCTQTP